MPWSKITLNNKVCVLPLKSKFTIGDVDTFLTKWHKLKNDSKENVERILQFYSNKSTYDNQIDTSITHVLLEANLGYKYLNNKKTKSNNCNLASAVRCATRTIFKIFQDHCMEWYN